MAPTPKRLDSVEVFNKSQAPAVVTVSFDNHKDSVELLEEHTIEAGGAYHFQVGDAPRERVLATFAAPSELMRVRLTAPFLTQEKVLDMGSWQAVAPVKRVSVAQEGGSHSVEPSVSGVVKKIEIHVVENGQLVQQPS